MISIILPIYQVENYIKNCVISICNQTIKDFEVLLVNDGTKDNSILIAEEVLRSYKMNYKIINQENRGVAAARNLGIKHASGDFVVCVDSDDILTEDFLSVLKNAIQKDNTKLSIGNFKMVNEQNLFKPATGTSSSIIIKKEEYLDLFLQRKINIISPAILIERKIIEEKNLWYPENISFSEDVYWIWQALLSVDKISYVNATIYNYNVREGSTMRDSHVEKILTGYYGFKNYNYQIKQNENILLRNYFFSRWVLGALRSSTKMLNYKDFFRLTNEMNYKYHAKKLNSFPEIKAKTLSYILYYSRRLFFWIGKL